MNDEQIEINEEKLSRLKRLSEKLDDSITIPGTCLLYTSPSPRD